MQSFDPTVYPDLETTTILLTGATDGIGFETAKLLSQTPCHLILHGRNPQKMARVLAEVKALDGPAKVDMELAGLSAMANVRDLAARVRQRYPQLNLLINNAGVAQQKTQMTVDGNELTVAVNHLAPLLLTLELADLLRGNAPSRVVNLGSMGHRFGIVNLRQIQSWNNPSGWLRYCCSKTLLMAVTRKVGKLLDQSGVSVLSVHPGAIPSTNVYRVPILDPFSLKPIHGAHAVVNAALNPDLRDAHGAYFNRFKVELPGFQVRNPRFIESAWQQSLDLLNIHEEDALEMLLGPSNNTALRN